jgi:hypothetical protein
LLGGLLAAIATVFYHQAVGRFFALLRKNGADSPETAKTLAELGIRRAIGLRRTLTSRSSVIRKLVSVRLEDGTVIAPIHSFDDDVAAEESEKSAIHAEEPKKRRQSAAYVRPGEVKTAVSPETTAAVAEGEGSPEAAEGAGAPKDQGAAGAMGTAVSFHPDKVAYFLDDVHRRRAEVRFEKRGNDVRFLLPAILAFVALAATLPIYLPYFAKILDGLLTSLFGGVL